MTTHPTEFEAPDWEDYQERFQYKNPHARLEPDEMEKAIVFHALSLAEGHDILAGVEYDEQKFQAFRAAVREHFEIPWTAISPRMQRLIYAINAIHKPQVMIAAGIFCGNTFISNAGAAIGDGAVYEPGKLVGLEIDEDKAALARRNVEKVDPGARAEIRAEDAVAYLEQFEQTIDLLYIDADGPEGKGKAIYQDILEAGYGKLRDGSLILAHNAVNAAEALRDYLQFVRDPTYFQQSIRLIVDGEGLEVTMR